MNDHFKLQNFIEGDIATTNDHYDLLTAQQLFMLKR